MLYNGKVSRYKAQAGVNGYLDNRAKSRKQYKRLSISPFCKYMEQHFTEDK